ncbi:Uu.00g117980.m01.CDS01 [Anthostomella pinea]|uniref:Uu.00g117980.m01.CDS01 n=1 Tax=Anthostomella pinea TaxID=933095 RepID=A0AAI8VHD3_9PEZI|nr:Uu.00g117980.m01.CDS01 [Anthostomella pinea]
MPRSPLEGFFKGVKLAYESGKDAYKKPFHDLITKKHCWILFEPEFLNLSEGVPKFLRWQLEQVQTKVDDKDYHPDPPLKCQKCKQTLFIAPTPHARGGYGGNQFYFEHVEEDNNAQLIGTCNSCINSAPSG